MRRYTDMRYVPYMRTRYRSRPVVWNGSVRETARSFVLFIRLILCIACFIFALNGMVKNFHGAVENICEYKAAQLVNEYIDEGVLKASENYTGESFVIVTADGSGQVASVETNALEVNRFAAILSESILEEIKNKQQEKIMAPLGSLTGNGLLSSFGFSIPYSIIPAGKVTVSPVSAFDDAGINQTIHRLQMVVSVNVKILFPLMEREESVTRTVFVSETVIIGDVPNTLLSRRP